MKINKKILLTSIISGVLSSTITVAAVSLSAKEIGFTSTDSEWLVENVEDAVNDLYQISINNTPVAKVFSAQTAASKTTTLTKSYTITEAGTYRFIVMNSNYKAYISTQTLTKNGSSLSLSSLATHYPKYDATYTYITPEVECVVGDVIKSTFVSNVTGDNVWTPYTSIIPIRLK